MMTEIRDERQSYIDQSLFRSEPSIHAYMDNTDVLRSYPLPVWYADSFLQP